MVTAAAMDTHSTNTFSIITWLRSAADPNELVWKRTRIKWIKAHAAAIPWTLTVSFCPLTDIKEEALVLVKDTLTLGRHT